MNLETIIDGLSRDQQIIAMEMLWKRLSQGPDNTAPPTWHRDIVAERVAGLQDGTESLSDWADVKKRLADRLQ
ncbi:Putative addiction module component [Rosistilla carotiformis]|uniref:Addiction module component n=1 Tax=Rosistilla carotiformis TaxID=2528017 RepID=A0A518JUS5_9BACT|nr:addiction module protein [Rosistilla carotiformis]QDV69297.1 Putative addiction module component [Rosistilla carotiformis]